MFAKRNKEQFQDIGRSPEAADYLAAQLERLMNLPLATPAELERWYEERDTVEANLKRRFSHFEPFHEVWHFFADADIRSRDTRYCERQHHLMSEYIRQLRSESRNA